MQLEMFRGNTKKFNLTVTQGSTPVNLTGAGLWFTVRRCPGGTQVMQKSVGAGITLTDAAAGLARVTIDPADTTSLPSAPISMAYDVEYEAGGEVYTLVTGELVVHPDITVR